jgi:hypothetical protein
LTKKKPSEGVTDTNTLGVKVAESFPPQPPCRASLYPVKKIVLIFCPRYVLISVEGKDSKKNNASVK